MPILHASPEHAATASHVTRAVDTEGHRCGLPSRSLDTRAAGRAPPTRRLQSHHLLDGSAEIEIEHGESVYRLRLTALGKLILTK